jgi:hypothetical protein
MMESHVLDGKSRLSSERKALKRTLLTSRNVMGHVSFSSRDVHRF